MFFPLSKPKEVFEPQPTTLVGNENTSENKITYRIRPLSAADNDVHVSFSDLVTNIINKNGDIKDLSNAAPLISQEIKASSNAHSVEEGHGNKDNYCPEKSIKAEVELLLSSISAESKLGSPRQTSKVNETRTNIEGNGHQANIHSLSKNDADILNVKSMMEIETEGEFQYLNELTSSRGVNYGERRFGEADMLTPAETAFRAEAVDISKVFDPSDQQDIELFGLDYNGEDDEDDDSDGGEDDHHDQANQRKEMGAQTSLVSTMLKKLDINMDGGNAESQIDDELDTLIGESYGASDLSEYKRKKARLTKNRKHNDDSVWAVDDTMDVSDFGLLVPEPAIEYPFNLDTFQKRAVYRLERDENVFVAAHTSAGKTVVAEYAIALAMHRKTKVIYTSPIKTLSNQKFRDFTERFTTMGFGEGDDRQFGNVGIITGDLSINPEADCLIMTTEILRSMLYKGADVIRDLSHVIFDECHWLNNPDRGVVWEEAIIMLPKSVTIIMLSATVPNAMEFAKWVGTTKEKPVYVVYTPKRPVPLSHQIFVKGEVFKLFESSQSRFLDAGYRRAAAHHKESTKNNLVRQGGGRNHTWMQMIKYLRKRDLDPAIFFCFSKKKCDEAAQQLNALDLTSGAADKSHIHQFYQNAIARLSADDRNVPQITRHREMLKRGLGVHHAGLLPIIKEITEVLFQSGYIRILFATETFAMGVNMPARTVVFTAIHKFDSKSFRLLEPGEYVQMAGRAGRRGLDDVGTVILYPSIADFPVESDVKNVLAGSPRPLRSQFRLTYNMILNLLRIEELRVEDVMARSFSEAPAKRNSKGLKIALEKGSKKLTALQQQSSGLQSFRELFDISLNVESFSKDVARHIIAGVKLSTSALSPGQIVLVRRPDRTLRLGVIVKGMGGSGSIGIGKASLRPRRGLGASLSSSNPDSVKVVTLLGGQALGGVRTPLCAIQATAVQPSAQGKQFNCNGIIVEIGAVALESVDDVSTLFIKVNERALNPIRGAPNMAALSGVAEELRTISVDKQYWKGLPSTNAARDIGLNDIDLVSAWEHRSASVRTMIDILNRLVETGAVRDLIPTFQQLNSVSKLESKLGKLRAATSDETLQLMPDYRVRALVLHRLGYIDETTVRLKGRAACEVNTCESIILTELVYEQVLQSLSAADLAAVLSALVFTDRLEEGEIPDMDNFVAEAEDVVKACGKMEAVILSIGHVMMEFGVDALASPAEYVRANARFGFVKGVREWAFGVSFATVCANFNGLVAEGSIVRTIVRLCELLRELKNVGRVIGDPQLQSRAQEACDLCRRDVIFAASLYVT